MSSPSGRPPSAATSRTSCPRSRRSPPTLADAVPEAAIGDSLRTVYGGVALTVPANRVDDLLAIPGVVAVQQDKLRAAADRRQRASSSAPTTLYPQLGRHGQRRRGRHLRRPRLRRLARAPVASPTRATMPTPPPTLDGRTRPCNFGDNPLTPASDPFVCNNKLIAGQVFLDTYLLEPQPRRRPEPYRTSARDSNGHGTHTGIDVGRQRRWRRRRVFGVERGPINGIAPGAWVAVYKVCGIARVLPVRRRGGGAAGDPRRRRRDQLLDLRRHRTRPPTSSSWRSSTPTQPACSSPPRPATPARAPRTANHLSPWTTTVAASTPGPREFASTLTRHRHRRRHRRRSSALDHGRRRPPTPGRAPVGPAVLQRPLCLTHRQPAGTFTGMIVACQRGPNARVEKGYNVRQGRRRRHDPLQPDLGRQPR